MSAARGSSLTEYPTSPQPSAPPMPSLAGPRKRWHWSRAPSRRSALVRVMDLGLITFRISLGGAYLAAGRIDEATSYAREALALTRQLGGRVVRALSLT